MMSNTFHGDDCENLSALFDGELEGDAARFALKRLGHDAQWRQACGRWQLCGDVLRGRAQGVAPADFADRVAAAIAAEAAIQRSRESVAAAPAEAIRERPRRRRGWFGGAALAASVAVAALFVARPFSEESAGGADPAQVTVPALAAAPAQPQPSAPAAADPAAAPAAPAATSGDASALAGGAAATAVAVAELPRRLNERRSRGQSQRAALRASAERRAEAPVQVAAIGGASPLPSADAAHNPFRPQQSEAPAARPWPRAVLPNFPANSGYTASYGSSALSPSFYPFEPAAAVDEGRPRPPAPERAPQR